MSRKCRCKLPVYTQFGVYSGHCYYKGREQHRNKQKKACKTKMRSTISVKYISFLFTQTLKVSSILMVLTCSLRTSNPVSSAELSSPSYCQTRMDDRMLKSLDMSAPLSEVVCSRRGNVPFSFHRNVLIYVAHNLQWHWGWRPGSFQLLETCTLMKSFISDLSLCYQAFHPHKGPLPLVVWLHGFWLWAVREFRCSHASCCLFIRFYQVYFASWHEFVYPSLFVFLWTWGLQRFSCYKVCHCVACYHVSWFV